MSGGPPVAQWLDHDGRLLRLRLNRPTANVIDGEMIDALEAALTRHRDNRELASVMLDAEGPNFSFGASVEEHLPQQCKAMLARINALVLALAGFPVPVLTLVHGQCLGGGLEVAAAGHFIFATPDAQFGQPEIKVGVFAPAASCLLVERVGLSRAEDILYSGRSVAAEEALAMGLVNAVTDDPERAALAYVEKRLLPHSASTLRYAVRAVRDDLVARLERRLAAVEELYLEELMSSRDAAEGLEAFLEKRPAKWEHR